MLSVKYNCNNQIKGDKIERHIATMGEEEKCIKSFGVKS
jgi:hypothetical protein